MINIFKIIFFISFGLQGQTSDQINQAKKIIKQTGMSESDARAAAKLRGFSPKQIDKVIQAEKGKNTRKEKVDISSTKNTSTVEPDLSSIISGKKNTDSIIDDGIKDDKDEVSAEDELIDKLQIESEGQPKGLL